MLSDDGVHQGGTGLGVIDVERHTAVRGTQTLTDGLGALLGRGGTDDRGTGPCQRVGDGLTNAARGAGDQGDLPFEVAEDGGDRSGICAHENLASVDWREAASLTLCSCAWGAIRLIRPVRTLPGPNSTNWSTPLSASA